MWSSLHSWTFGLLPTWNEGYDSPEDYFDSRAKLLKLLNSLNIRPATGFHYHEVNGKALLFTEISSQLSIYLFKNLKEEDKSLLYKLLELNKSFDSLEKFYGTPFLELLNNIDPLLLHHVTLFDLQLAATTPQIPQIHYLLTTDEKIMALEKETIEKFSEQVIDIVRNRLTLIEMKMSTPPSTSSLLLGIRSLEGAPLQNSLKHLSHPSLGVLSNRQITTLDFENFTLEQMRYLFKLITHPLRGPLLRKTLNAKQIRALIVKTPELDIESLPKEWRPFLNLGILSEDKVYDYYPLCYSHLQHEEMLNLFHALAPDEINENVHKLSPQHIGRLSERQIEKLDLTKLSQDQLDTLKSRLENEHQATATSHRENVLNVISV